MEARRKQHFIEELIRTGVLIAALGLFGAVWHLVVRVLQGPAVESRPEVV